VTKRESKSFSEQRQTAQAGRQAKIAADLVPDYQQRPKNGLKTVFAVPWPTFPGRGYFLSMAHKETLRFFIS